jgi:hypothetical protein
MSFSIWSRGLPRSIMCVHIFKYYVPQTSSVPVKLGKKKYEKFSDASAAIQKKKGISKDRANAYVASVERKQGIEPWTGKKKTKTIRRKSKK